MKARSASHSLLPIASSDKVAPPPKGLSLNLGAAEEPVSGFPSSSSSDPDSVVMQFESFSVTGSGPAEAKVLWSIDTETIHSRGHATLHSDHPMYIYSGSCGSGAVVVGGVPVRGGDVIRMDRSGVVRIRKEAPK